MRDSTEQFRKTSGETQREPLVEVSVPALTWHRSFLIPRKAAAGVVRYTRKEMKSKLDEIILLFLREYSFEKVYPTLSGLIILFDSCIDAQTLEMKEPTTKRHRSIFHGDERIIIIKIKWKSIEPRYEIFDFFDISIRVQMRANLFNVSVVATPQGAGRLEVDNAEQFRQWTEHFWVRFAASLSRLPGMRELVRSPEFAILFADVRGLVLPAQSRQDRPWAEEAVNSLRPILSADPDSELTISYLLDGQALVLSTVGSKSLHIPERKNTPVTFILCVPDNTPSSNVVIDDKHIGRLLDTMHVVATFRLAALLDLDLLRRASEKLSQIEPWRQNAQAQIETFEQHKSLSIETREALDRLGREVASVSDRFLNDNPGGVGLTFRIESSRYYASQLRENIKFLGLKDFAGFIRYDHFIERRLGVTFEFIDRLGIRLARAKDEMSAIDQNFGSYQALHFNETLMDIQRDGELILLSVLVPYYLMSAISHVMGFEEKTPKQARLFYAALWVWFVSGSVTKWCWTKFGLGRIYAKATAIAAFLFFAVALTAIAVLVLP